MTETGREFTLISSDCDQEGVPEVESKSTRCDLWESPSFTGMLEEVSITVRWVCSSGAKAATTPAMATTATRLDASASAVSHGATAAALPTSPAAPLPAAADAADAAAAVPAAALWLLRAPCWVTRAAAALAAASSGFKYTICFAERSRRCTCATHQTLTIRFEKRQVCLALM